MDLNPANPMSPLSPVHPLNTETEVVAPLPHKVPSFDWTINWLTIVLLVIGALIFAGWWWSRWRDSRRARREWTALKGEIVIRKTRQEKFKPECQSCSSFISCAMAGVSKCPLIEKNDG